jgi:hypothetical protein
VGDVDRDVVRHQALGHQLVDRGVVGLLDAQRNRGVQAACHHVAHEDQVVEVEAVHHIEVTVLRQPDADRFVDHGFHVGRHHRDAEPPPAELGAGITFRTALDAALARQQQDVLVVEYFHGVSKLQKTVEVNR